MATTLWAAYAAAIASLAAPAGLNLGSTQRFAISNQNDFSIPAVPYVNQYYQNHNVYRFASVIPAKDPVLTLKDSKSQFAPSGHTYDAAYTKYIDSVLLQVPHDVRIQAQINETVTKMADLTNKIAETRAQAQVNFARDCPNGIDPFTDKPVTLGEYAAINFPQLANYYKTYATLEQVRFELDSAATGGQQRARLVEWREAMAKGKNTTNYFPSETHLASPKFATRAG